MSEFRQIFTETDSFLQTPYWADVKRQEGWRPYFFDEQEGRILLLVRSLSSKIAIGYVPLGWDHSPLTAERVSALSRKWAKETAEPLFLIKWDLPLYTVFRKDEGIDLSFDFGIGRPLKKAVADIQPPDTVCLNVQQEDSVLLAAMHKKTKYNIGYAERAGVCVREASVEELPKWYELYRMTAARDKIAIHSQMYYKHVLEKSVSMDRKDESPSLKLYFAEHQDDLLAGIIVLFYKKKAVYLYGASSNTKRNLMPAYLLQWKAICEARQQGCREYDFYGIPPANDPHHPMYGLYRFKTGFGGMLIHRCGVYDCPLRPGINILFRIAERSRQFYYKKIRKRISFRRNS